MSYTPIDEAYLVYGKHNIQVHEAYLVYGKHNKQVSRVLHMVFDFKMLHDLYVSAA